MSVEVFRLIILGMCAIVIAIATYCIGKSKGYLEGYDRGYNYGYEYGFWRKGKLKGGDAK